MKPSKDISRLIEIMAALRTPNTGCPWDLEQDFKSIAPYTIEEAYEVADAIERGDMEDLRLELGDLLLRQTPCLSQRAHVGSQMRGGIVHGESAGIDPRLGCLDRPLPRIQQHGGVEQTVGGVPNRGSRRHP